MPEVSQDAFEAKNPLEFLLTPEIMRARANTLTVESPFSWRNRENSGSDVEEIETRFDDPPYLKGFKRQLGHR